MLSRYKFLRIIKNTYIGKKHSIEAKIRQQLQFLRDIGFIEFLGIGQYRKIK
ncbi:MAG: hypothetical protein K2M73_01940 [Lachnospiraceae bacterium]|nr:hypothetical protein [Lachnospiraceae bacterium]